MNELVQLTIRQQLNELANLIEGSAWGADRGKPRIYMRSTRDRKIFFDFPDCPTGDADDVLGGAIPVLHRRLRSTSTMVSVASAV